MNGPILGWVYHFCHFLFQSSVTTYPTPSIEKKDYESQNFLELPSPYRRETSEWLEPRSVARSQSPPETKKSSGSSFFRSLRSLSRMSSNNSTKDLDEIENTPPLAANINSTYPSNPTRIAEDIKQGEMVNCYSGTINAIKYCAWRGN